MVIEKLRQKAQRDAARQHVQGVMRKNAETTKRGRSKAAKKSLMQHPLITHKVFIPILSVWGAALGGLNVMALSGVTIARLSMFTGLGALGSSAKVAFAVVAALIGGGLAFIIASFVQNKAQRKSQNGPIAAFAARRVRPIDPAAELGSESLDSPIEDMPFSMAQEEEPDEAEDDYAFDMEDMGDELQTDELQTDELQGDEAWIEAMDLADDISDFEAEFDAGQDKGQDTESDTRHDDTLDLNDFHALDNVDAVVEATDTLATHSDDAAKTAIEKLRQTQPSELSIVQLVERFAAALHDVQEKAPHAMNDQEPQRDKALAQALKALSLFTERGFAQSSPSQTPETMSASTNQPATLPDTSIIRDTESELRDALAKLQNLRGAA